MMVGSEWKMFGITPNDDRVSMAPRCQPVPAGRVTRHRGCVGCQSGDGGGVMPRIGFNNGVYNGTQ